MSDQNDNQQANPDGVRGRLKKFGGQLGKANDAYQVAKNPGKLAKKVVVQNTKRVVTTAVLPVVTPVILICCIISLVMFTMLTVVSTIIVYKEEIIEFATEAAETGACATVITNPIIGSNVALADALGLGPADGVITDCIDQLGVSLIAERAGVTDFYRDREEDVENVLRDIGIIN